MMIREWHTCEMMIWEQIAAVIQPALALNSGRSSIAELRAQAAGGHVRIWLAESSGELLGAVVGYEIPYPNRRSLAVLLIAGRERERWQYDMMEVVEGAARASGCDLIEGVGREGFGRVLPGYKVVGLLYEKDLRG